MRDGELPGMWEEADLIGGETDDVVVDGGFFPSWINQDDPDRPPPPRPAADDCSTGEWLNFMERQDAYDRRRFWARVRDWFVRRKIWHE